MVSASDTISVTFQSDGRLTDRGFSAKWEAVYPEDIGGTEHTTYTQGMILTPEAHVGEAAHRITRRPTLEKIFLSRKLKKNFEFSVLLMDISKQYWSSN